MEVQPPFLRPSLTEAQLEAKVLDNGIQNDRHSTRVSVFYQIQQAVHMWKFGCPNSSVDLIYFDIIEIHYRFMLCVCLRQFVAVGLKCLLRRQNISRIAQQDVETKTEPVIF